MVLHQNSLSLFTLKNKTSRFVSPHLMLAYNGQEGATSGDFYWRRQLSFGNVYSNKKYSSQSESELGVSIAVGIDYEVDWEERRRLNVSFAGTWLEDVTYSNKNLTLLDAGKPNFIANLNYKNSEKFSVAGQILASDKGSIVHSNIMSEFQTEDFKISGEYEFINESSDSRLENDLKNFYLVSSLNLTEDLRLKAKGRYSLNSKSFPDQSYGAYLDRGMWNFGINSNFSEEQSKNTELSAIYNNDCTKVLISLQNTDPSSFSSESIQSLTISIQLNRLLVLRYLDFN